MKLLAKII